MRYRVTFLRRIFMLKCTFLTLLVLAGPASAGTWTCTAACARFDHSTPGYHPHGLLVGPNYKYVSAQAPSAKDAFEKLAEACDALVPNYGMVFGGISGPIEYGSGKRYLGHPVKLSEACVRDDDEASAIRPSPS
jgi:hypothetical protein